MQKKYSPIKRKVFKSAIKTRNNSKYTQRSPPFAAKIKMMTGPEIIIRATQVNWKITLKLIPLNTLKRLFIKSIFSPIYLQIH